MIESELSLPGQSGITIKRSFLPEVHDKEKQLVDYSTSRQN